ncbi:hypothetical protein [Microbulbifer sp. JTAC008]
MPIPAGLLNGREDAFSDDVRFGKLLLIHMMQAYSWAMGPYYDF